MNKKTELLMPAGSLEKLIVAFKYGADAVYMGMPGLSLRTKSKLTLEETIQGVNYAKSINKKVYLTLNIFSHNNDVTNLIEYIKIIKDIKPHGLIISDPGIINLVKTHAPDINIHVSTQANACSWLTVKFWQDQGAELVVLGREVSFEELKEIREKCPNIKLEAFVHGAMCMTYSGRCLLSNYLAQRGSNQGSCANSCRWNYKLKLKLKDDSYYDLDLNENNKDLFEFLLEEQMRPGELMPIEEDEKGSYILNAKDLCLLPVLSEYLSIGVDTFKVEGRNKSLLYIATIAKIYRMAIDLWYENPDKWDYKQFLTELKSIPHRGLSMAFHSGKLEHFAHNYNLTSSFGTHELAGVVTKTTDDGFYMLVKTKIVSQDVLEFITFDAKANLLLRIYEFNVDNTSIQTQVNGNSSIFINFSSFHLIELAKLKTMIQPNMIVKKLKELDANQNTRLMQDKFTMHIELNEGNSEYNKAQYAKLQQEPFKHGKIKSKCCGKACNGCLIFWHDDEYAKQREIFLQKKHQF